VGLEEVPVPLRALEIIGHGKVLVRSDGATSHLSVNLELPADHGLWIAARCQAGPGQVAHTTPGYVTVGGDGFHNPQTAGQRLDVAERYLKELEQELASPGSSLDSQAARHKAPLERQIAEARATIKTMRSLALR
jgi:hypothetical protein